MQFLASYSHRLCTSQGAYLVPQAQTARVVPGQGENTRIASLTSGGLPVLGQSRPPAAAYSLPSPTPSFDDAINSRPQRFDGIPSAASLMAPAVSFNAVALACLAGLVVGAIIYVCTPAPAAVALACFVITASLASWLSYSSRDESVANEGVETLRRLVRSSTSQAQGVLTQPRSEEKPSDVRRTEVSCNDGLFTPAFHAAARQQRFKRHSPIGSRATIPISITVPLFDHQSRQNNALTWHRASAQRSIGYSASANIGVHDTCVDRQSRTTVEKTPTETLVSTDMLRVDAPIDEVKLQPSIERPASVQQTARRISHDVARQLDHGPLRTQAAAAARDIELVAQNWPQSASSTQYRVAALVQLLHRAQRKTSPSPNIDNVLRGIGRLTTCMDQDATRRKITLRRGELRR